MHVSITTTIALAIINENTKIKISNVPEYNTNIFCYFLIKQHYLVDSISGLIIGYVGFFKIPPKILKT